MFGVETLSYPLKDNIAADNDAEFIDFIQSCLEIDPQKRWTPEDALKHPWIKRNNLRQVVVDN